MANFFSDFWKILKLDIQPFEKVKNDKSGILIALRLFLVIAVIATVGEFAALLLNQRPSVTTSLENIAVKSQEISDKLPPVLGDGFSQVAQFANDVSNTLESFQPPLGKEASNILRGIGIWLSMPLSMLNGWMAAALAVFLAARLLKGKGEIREHISIFLLGFSPQFLLMISGFSFLNPVIGSIGGLLTLVAWVWSLILVTVGLDIVHGFGKGKALASIVVAFGLSFLVFVVIIPSISLVSLLLGFIFKFI